MIAFSYTICDFNFLELLKIFTREVSRWLLGVPFYHLLEVRLLHLKLARLKVLALSTA